MLCNSKAGADILVQENIYGWTALHLAAVDGHAKVVEALIKAGANPSKKVIGDFVVSDLNL